MLEAVVATWQHARSRACRSVAFGVSALIACVALAGCSTSPGNGLSTAQPGTPSGFPTDVSEPANPRNASLQGASKATFALLLPVSATGQTAAIANGLKQAAELALFDRNADGVKLLVKDTAGTPEGARKAAEAAVAEGAEVILGPLFGKSVAAVRPVAAAANLPVIAFSNDTSVAGNGVYLLSFQAHQDIERIVSYTAAQGRLRFAALIPDDTNGKIVANLFREAVVRHNGSVIAMEVYPPGANGMLEKAQKLFETVAGAQDLGAPIDAVFIPGGPETLPTIGPIISYTKVDTTQVKLIGTGSWDFPSLSRQKAFIGGWYPAPDPRGWQTFASKYVQTYGSAAPRIASFAYDAVSIAISLAGNGPRGQRLQPAQIMQASGFAGIDGAVRFRNDGRVDRGLAVLEVTPNGTRMIDPAPRAFTGPQG